MTVRYADGSQELYDMIADPNEWTNLAGDAKHAGTIRELAAFLPKVDVPAESSESVVVRFSGREEGEGGMRRWVVWARHGAAWTMRVVVGGAGAEGHASVERHRAAGELDRVAVCGLDAFGRIGEPTIVPVMPAPVEGASAVAEAATVAP